MAGTRVRERAAAWARDYAYAARVQLGVSLRRRSVPRPRGDLAPVLLIPGVYEHWQFLRAAGGRLARAGHPVHAVEPLGYNRIPVPDAAAVAQRYLDEHDLTEVVVVAHSKGGLIGKHMMLVDDTEGRIDRLVAIAAPFSGSSLSRYTPTRALRAFVPTETTLAMLAANAEVNARITSIYPEFDPHIPGGSELPGATNLLLPVAGHFRLLADERVLDAVLDAVDGTAPDVATGRHATSADRIGTQPE
jgi:pimeloyl-ACP methyl ester carboxylesterase